MRQKIKQHKTLGIALLLAICLTTMMGVISYASGQNTEGKMFEIGEANEEVGTFVDENIAAVYKNSEAWTETCEKYGLDPWKTNMADLSSEVFDEYYALSLIKDKGDYPLLEEYVDAGAETDGPASLEMELNDIYAYDGSKGLILEACEKAGIDPATGVCSDFTLEQMIELNDIAFQTSPHGDY